MNDSKSNVLLSMIMGHAVADALGVPVEFKDRSELKKKPLTDMIGYGTYPMPPGTWSDDTSMNLALLDSLIQSYPNIDYEDIMEKFRQWAVNGKYTATGEVFDVGISTHSAVRRYMQGTPALKCGGCDEYDNGNGSLMRISPAVYYCISVLSDKDIDTHIDIIHKVSSITHAHPRSKIACGIYYFILKALIKGEGAVGIKKALLEAKDYYVNKDEFKDDLSCYERLFEEDFKDIREDEINSSGYVVDTLEAAVWCLLNTVSYKECVLKAANLGKDTDTVAAVSGAMAGVLYGIDNIPESWRKTLINSEYLIGLCDGFERLLG